MKPSVIRLALYEPDIPQNAGTLLRLCACLGVDAHLIEPTGFPPYDRAFRRAGMDYLDAVSLQRHISWTQFQEWRQADRGRLVLATTKAAEIYTDFRFLPGDIIMTGRESAGVPDSVHGATDARIKIPMRSSLRSINVAVAAAMLLGEALRQTSGFPAEPQGD